jgi:AraC-like DNA-binding protein
MNLQQQPATASLPALLDLDVIDTNQRAAAWECGARAFFPGLSVRDLSLMPLLGSIAGARFGAGHLWSILSPALQVTYDPQGTPPERKQLFSLMLQLSGATLAGQEGRLTRINPGQMCVIDGRLPFELAVDGMLSHFVVLQMPRQAVLSRNPSLERHTALTFDPADSGTVLLRNLLLCTAETTPSLRDDQRGAALASIVQLLGALRIEGQTDNAGSSWRVRTALSWIENALADPELTATKVAEAQGVSRRRLDQIMVEVTGIPVSSQIWQRRLEQAASDLRNARYASKTVTQIAFAAGFDDVAHFSRAFKRRYRVPPREWRRGELSPPGNPGAVNS